MELIDSSSSSERTDMAGSSNVQGDSYGGRHQPAAWQSVSAIDWADISELVHGKSRLAGITQIGKQGRASGSQCETLGHEL